MPNSNRGDYGSEFASSEVPFSPSFMSKKRSDINYFLIFIIVIFGVAIGNLISTFVVAKAVEYQAQQAMAEAAQVMQRQNREAQAQMNATAQRNAALLEQQQAALRAQRAADPNGVRLSQTCAEWRKADANLNSYTTQTELAKSCARYDSYVMTGIYPTAK